MQAHVEISEDEKNVDEAISMNDLLVNSSDDGSETEILHFKSNSFNSENKIIDDAVSLNDQKIVQNEKNEENICVKM